ncbi:fatty-acid amide hydrolase 1 [Plakobranchus ocellatus]|uniref:fatty acid amide hydrolase n=1 Tax=Plakobranchus ocellatus TaxID=259542 RepID=A0AAV4BLY1_9GAST|nr:fatty-acid amide hydrolase 1 [Plakobranchus ocellatus]
MALQNTALEFCETLQTTMQDSIMILTPGVGAALLASCATVMSGLYMYRRQRKQELRLKMEARGQRAKRDMEELRRELSKHKIQMDLVQLSFQQLQEALQTGKVKATDVLRAYQAKALEVNNKTNAITDVIKSASAHAAKLDALSPDQRGPLHGIPISLKETCGLKSLDCTSGFGELIDIPMKEDSPLVQALKLKGAVPFVRTNIPQGMRSFACANGIFGVTKNPHNPSRGPGGSSGGEGAMIGGQGSILGVGSDIGGSVRIPACFCGLASLKPTCGRIGWLGNFNPGTVNGQNIVITTDGPMGRDVTSVVQFMRAVLAPELWAREPLVPPLPFRQEVFTSKRPLRIGYYIHNGCMQCVPAVERAVLLAKTVLESQGHTLVKFDVKPKALYAFSNIFMPLLMADNGECYEDLLRYDDSCDLMTMFFKLCKAPYWTRYLLAKITELRTFDPVTVEVLNQKPSGPVTDFYKKTIDVQEFQQQFAKEWKKLRLDVVLCPGMPTAAPIAGNDKKLLNCASYTALWNVVNYPAGIVPVTKVTSSDVTKTFDPACFPADTETERIMREDACGSEGLPVAVQVAGLPYTEEMVLRVMAELEAAITPKLDRL